jgi:hypothetical protein
MRAHINVCKYKKEIKQSLIKDFKLCHGYVPGDPGDSALGGYEGKIRGPNDLASGGLDGLGAGLGNIVAAE